MLCILKHKWSVLILAGLLAGSRHAAAQQAPAGSTSSATNSSTNHPQVIIIGAGMAGVAAAKELTDRGINVLLLEARDRPGGRLHSVMTKAGAVDLGAMWIHEAHPGNAVYDLTQQLGINISQPHNYQSASLFNPDGSPGSFLNYAVAYSYYNRDILGNITRLRAAANASSSNNNSSPSADASSVAAFSGRRLLNSSTAAAAPAAASPVTDMPLSALTQPWLEGTAWGRDQRPFANAVVHINFQSLLNANVSQLSTLRYGDAKTLPAVDVLLQPGYDAVVKRLLPGLHVRYNSTVTAVDQDAAGVAVTLGYGKVLRAAYALVTLPLGVLKAGAVTFKPPLPAEKQAAISSMGMGVLDKVVLVFPEEHVFWSKSNDFLLLARNDSSGKWSNWLNYYKMWRMPVLVALNPAETALQLEAMTDAEVVADAMAALRSIYSNDSSSVTTPRAAGSPALQGARGFVPEPVQALVTRWGADPFARGAYSYYATGNPKNITDALAEPFGRVLFAGEATSSKPATVLGAYLSGKREAARLLQLLQRSSSSGAAGPPVPATGAPSQNKQ